LARQSNCINAISVMCHWQLEHQTPPPAALAAFIETQSFGCSTWDFFCSSSSSRKVWDCASMLTKLQCLPSHSHVNCVLNEFAAMCSQLVVELGVDMGMTLSALLAVLSTGKMPFIVATGEWQLCCSRGQAGITLFAPLRQNQQVQDKK
jgi:hypothetical protein